MKEQKVKVLENGPIALGICRMRFSLSEKTEGISCGKFVNISVGDGAHLLRRPIAICEQGEENGKQTVTICYQVKGEGTQLLSRAAVGEELECLLPLGNGFRLTEKQKRVALIGGGVGIFPMISVLEEYAPSGKEFLSCIGFRNKDAVCMSDVFTSLSARAEIVTDDGSFGKKSNAVSAFFEVYDDFAPDVILACGPVPMLRALKSGLKERGIAIPCFVSLEERMGCGIGACLVCVCKRSGKEENARVCKDGPVFEINEVEI